MCAVLRKGKHVDRHHHDQGEEQGYHDTDIQHRVPDRRKNIQKSGIRVRDIDRDVVTRDSRDPHDLQRVWLFRTLPFRGLLPDTASLRQFQIADDRNDIQHRRQYDPPREDRRQRHDHDHHRADCPLLAYFSKNI